MKREKKRVKHRSVRPSAGRRASSSAAKPRRSTPKAKARKPAARKAPVSKARKPAVSRARATKPARSTHHLVILPKKRKRTPIPSPMPTRHVAPPRPVLQTPARSMPPREVRKPTVPAKAAFVIPEFTEAGIVLAITYSIREGRRNEFFELIKELKPLLASIGGTDCTVYEDRTRPNYFMEVFRFKDEPEFTAFDDKFHKDRKIAAIYALLDDIVEAEKSDFKIFERRL